MEPSPLRRFEKLSVPLLNAINTNVALKDFTNSTIGILNSIWMTHATGRLWRVDGEEHLKQLDAPQGIIIASNHRSFFDLYPCAALFMQRYPALMRRLYCPVRSEFFYTRPLGILLNLAVSGGSMWPPIFRDERRDLNLSGLKQLASVLHKGSCVGFHPEGTRGKLGQDPHTLLPAKSGLGLLFTLCHPDTIVLPYFTLGMSNDLWNIVRRNYRPLGQRGEIVSLRFGAPLRVGELLEGLNPTEATELVMERIRALAQEDKAMREVCSTT
jgi:1-acyl-sn-glycerol-3-phosphate acyltransferase